MKSEIEKRKVIHLRACHNIDKSVCADEKAPPTQSGDLSRTNEPRRLAFKEKRGDERDFMRHGRRERESRLGWR